MSDDQGQNRVERHPREGSDVLFTPLPEKAEDARETSRLVEDAGRKTVVVVPCDIRPGAIVTFTQGPAQRVADGRQAPLGRPARSADMAPAHVFLASERASSLTAEILDATGGTPLPWCPGARGGAVYALGRREPVPHEARRNDTGPERG